jgi:hypothetical protein
MLADAKNKRETIAVYSAWTSFPAMLVLLGFALVFIYGWFDIEIKRTGFFGGGIYATYALTIGSIFYVLLLPLLWKILRQMVFDGRRVIWIEDGCLVYLGPDYLTVPCSDISTLSLSYNSRNQEGVELVLSDGNKKFLPTGGLASSGDVIGKRLREICLPSEIRS